MDEEEFIFLHDNSEEISEDDYEEEKETNT